MELSKVRPHIGKAVAIVYKDAARNVESSILGFLLDVDETAGNRRVVISDELHCHEGEWTSTHRHNIQAKTIQSIRVMVGGEYVWST